MVMPLVGPDSVHGGLSLREAQAAVVGLGMPSAEVHHGGSSGALAVGEQAPVVKAS